MKRFIFNELDSKLEKLTNVACLAGGVMVLAMMVHICADVALRNLFNYILQGTQEIVTNYYMISIVFLPLAIVERRGGHVFVDVFTSKLPPRLLRGLDVSVHIWCAVAISIFFVAALDKAMQMTRGWEIEIGSIDLLVWPARWIFAFGLLMLACEFLLTASRGRVVATSITE